MGDFGRGDFGRGDIVLEPFISRARAGADSCRFFQIPSDGPAMISWFQSTVIINNILNLICVCIFIYHINICISTFM